MILIYNEELDEINIKLRTNKFKREGVQNFYFWIVSIFSISLF